MEGIEDEIGLEDVAEVVVVVVVVVVEAGGRAACVWRRVALGLCERVGEGASIGLACVEKGRKVSDASEVDSSERSELSGRALRRGSALKRGRREKVREYITGAVVTSSEDESDGEEERRELREGRLASDSASGTSCGRAFSLSKETRGRRGLVERVFVFSGDERWIWVIELVDVARESGAGPRQCPNYL